MRAIAVVGVSSSRTQPVCCIKNEKKKKGKKSDVKVNFKGKGRDKLGKRIDNPSPLASNELVFILIQQAHTDEYQVDKNFVGPD